MNASANSRVLDKSISMTPCPGTVTSSAALHYNHGAGERVRRSDREIDEYWSAVVTEEPVSDHLKILIREDLKRAWHFQREAEFLQITKLRWASTDSVRIVLKDAVGKVKPRKLAYLCNKPTAFYWLQSAQWTGASGQRNQTPTIIFAAIYEKWIRCHNTQPNIEYGHFFANPVRITSIGPSTVRGVIDAHRSLCAQASRLINQAKGRADNIIEQHPSSSQHYSLLPLYHSIVVIIDRFDSSDTEPESDGHVSLCKIGERQTVLIARTGMEEGLSAPISLESLKSQSLPLERSDVAPEDTDVVRVSLAAAVEYIVSLEMREGLANSKEKHEPSIDISLCPCIPQSFTSSEVDDSAEAWADVFMEEAEKHGYDNILDTWESIRRVRAGQIGETFREFKPWPIGNIWKW
ncbi:hypothetical protein PRK78_007163 [Emydomyces testavorans]|uniref:Uncharacterized protein n=1 Tax=Emydomyces testavorans TaxID=2070801 RepID=A0AAF0DQW9_9EURO|nr:hypothetical protein PRK78_007163 [Emydomyces testavorans]